MTTQIPDLNEEEMLKILSEVNNGHSISTVLNFKQEHLEQLYALAYNYYSTDSYKQAEKIFKMLCVYDYWDPRFSMGLAGCYQAMGNYEKAIEIYQMAGVAGGLDDPSPIYYASLCFINLGNREAAIEGLKSVLVLGNENEYVEIRKASKDLLEILKKE